MSDTTFMGVQRDKIPWYPTIDYAKCTFCMECDKFCPHHVFERRESHPSSRCRRVQTTVSCFAGLVPRPAAPTRISFPEKPATIALIKQIRQEEGAK